tara:strand:- start:280 stop:828 length:549 start_codon:yes stop_codon:yes gene_type:complete
MRIQVIYFLFFTTLFSSIINSQELVIGKEKLNPGITVVFEGAIKDQIYPPKINLEVDNTDVHIEARINWDNSNRPKGASVGGFIPYLNLNAKITNQKTGRNILVDLIPHINLNDNFHYARNISLPGNIDNLYNIEFTIKPPEKLDLSFHLDWSKKYGNKLIDEHNFKYNNINFYEVAKAIRN